MIFGGQIEVIHIIKGEKEIHEELLSPKSEALKNRSCILETTNYLVLKNDNYKGKNGYKKT